MLKGTLEVSGGTALGLPYDIKVNNEIGAKTGTTQNASDGWFFGVTQDLVGGVWVGGEDRSIHFKNWFHGQGAKTAMPIWGNFMQKVYADSTLVGEVRKKPFKKTLNVSLDCREYYPKNNKQKQTPQQEESHLDTIF